MFEHIIVAASIENRKVEESTGATHFCLYSILGAVLLSSKYQRHLQLEAYGQRKKENITLFRKSHIWVLLKITIDIDGTANAKVTSLESL
jgi:hypothetical protein